MKNKLKEKFDFIEIKNVTDYFFRVDIVKYSSYDNMLEKRRKVIAFMREHGKEYELEDLDVEHDAWGDVRRCSVYYVKAEE